MKINTIEFDSYMQEHAAIHVLHTISNHKQLTFSGIQQEAFFNMIKYDDFDKLIEVMYSNSLLRLSNDAYFITDEGFAWLRYSHESHNWPQRSLSGELDGLSPATEGVVFITPDDLYTLVTRVPNNNKAWVMWFTYPQDKVIVDNQIRRLESEYGRILNIRSMDAPYNAFQF